MAGFIDGNIQFFLQRRVTTGAWTTIVTSTQIAIETINDVPLTEIITGTALATFNAATLDWSTAAQYRILVRRDLDDSAGSVNITSAETRVYGVSTA